MAIAECTAAVLQMFKDSRVEDDVTMHVTTNPGIASVADWAVSVPRLNYEFALRVLMDSVDAHHGPPAPGGDVALSLATRQQVAG